MAKIPLREVVAAAHRALEAGDHALARATCQHILAEYPSYADMHRLYGEIMLEQGEAAIARQSFEHALAYDPQNVLATLGLGVLAEESLDLAAAAGYFQQALEIDPSLSQLRDELVRLYSKLYGHGGRLHLSGAGLAAIYGRGNQLTLAQRQYESLLAQQPNRLDLVIALAEVRWRAGDVLQAEQLCDQILAARPKALRPLYILADLHRRHGELKQAGAAFATAATIDPLHDVARVLEQNNPACSFTPLVRELAEITPFDPSQVIQPATILTTNTSLGVAPPLEEHEWRHLSTELNAGVVTPPATDASATDDGFQWPWEMEDQPSASPAPEPVAPIAATAVAPAAPTPAVSPAPTPAAATLAGDPGHDLLMADWASAVSDMDAARPSVAPHHGYTDTLREIDALGFKPFDEDATEIDVDLPINLAVFDSPTAVVQPPATQSEPVRQPTSASLPPAPAVAVPPVHTAPAAPIAPPVPVAPTPPPLATLPPTPAPPATAVAADAASALAELVGDWDNIDAELAAARPSDSDFEIDDLLPDLEEPGLQPFTSDGEPAVDAALIPSDWGAASTSRTTQDDGFVANGWADLDQQLSEAVPAAQMPRGFTTELRALSDEGLAPFIPDDVDKAGGQAHTSPAGSGPATPATPPALAAKTTWPATPPPADNDRTWADFEAELAQAVPMTTSLPHGYTADLRELDSQGVSPFLLKDHAVDVDSASSLAQTHAATTDDELKEALASLAEPPLSYAITAPAVTPPAEPAPLVSTNPTPPPTHAAAPFAPAVAPPVTLVEPAAAKPPTPETTAASVPAWSEAPVAPAVPAPATSPARAVVPPRPVTPPPARVGPPASRPLPLGSTISLAGSLFARLRERKQELMDLGQITVRPSVAVANGDPAGASAQALLRQAEEASDDQPTDPTARLQLATLYAETDQPVHAALCYRLLLRGEPDMLAELAAPIEQLAADYSHEPRVLRLLGDLYLRQGRYTQAMAVFRSLLVAGASA